MMKLHSVLRLILSSYCQLLCFWWLIICQFSFLSIFYSFLHSVLCICKFLASLLGLSGREPAWHATAHLFAKHLRHDTNLWNILHETCFINILHATYLQPSAHWGNIFHAICCNLSIWIDKKYDKNIWSCAIFPHTT